MDPIAPIKKEPVLVIPVLLITGVGIAMVYSASADISRDLYGGSMHYVSRQALFFAVGAITLYTAAWFPHRYLAKLVYPLLFISLACMISVLTPLGIMAGGARRWIQLPGLTFQPSEPAKLALILYLAASLAAKQAEIRKFLIGFLPHALVLGLFTSVLVLQKDLGAIVIMGGVTWSMMFIAGVPLGHLCTIVFPLIPFAYFFIYKVDYRLERITAFVNPWQDPLDSGYQLTHSLKAFGSGGLFGKGIGAGFQTEHFLPKPHTDFIFSVVGEELGLMGVLTLLVLYALILKRGTTIARNAHSLFGAFLAAGITFQLAAQVVINIGVTLGLLPTKGLTLPFISYGGTSLVVSMAAMGILINIGNTTRSTPRRKKTTSGPNDNTVSAAKNKRKQFGLPA